MKETGTIWRLLTWVMIIVLVLAMTSASWAEPLQNGLRQTVPTRTPLPATEAPEPTAEPTDKPADTPVPEPTQSEPTTEPKDEPAPTSQPTSRPASQPTNTAAPTQESDKPVATGVPTHVPEEPTVPASTAVVMPETGEGPGGGMSTALYAGVAALGVAGAAYVFWRRRYLSRQ